MKNMISFSLYGVDPFYCNGAIRCVAKGHNKYRDWEWRFYTGDSVPPQTVSALRSLGCRIIGMSGYPENHTSMLWRFLAAQDSEVAVFRDTDSPVLWRERAAVHEWMSTGRKLHCMRDHHEHRAPILGGMWGVRDYIADIGILIADYPEDNIKGVDQQFLELCIWPRYKLDSLLHVGSDNVHVIEQRYRPLVDEFGRRSGTIDDGTLEADFPTPRSYNEFVGVPYDYLDDETIRVYEETL